jgi:hypothetical protein
MIPKYQKNITTLKWSTGQLFTAATFLMAVFIEKSPVTSSTCYKTIKYFNTNQTWHKCWLDHCLCKTCLCLNFLSPWQRGDISKLQNITILRRFFPSKLISKCFNFTKDWDRVKCFSALVTNYFIIDLGSFIASHKSKIFLAMRGTAAHFNLPSNRRGHFPLLATPWCIFWFGAAPKKLSLFSTTFHKRKQVLGA